MWGDEIQQRAFGKIWPLWNGSSEIRNRRQAVQRLRLLADEGYAPAQFVLAWAYFTNDGVRRDDAQAFHYFQLSAAQHFPAAEGMLGAFYAMVKPKQNVCPHDPVMAVHWYRRGAGAGNAGAQYNLASAYRTGSGVEKSDFEAYLWASLAVHCTTLPRDRMAEVIRDEAVTRLTPEQKAAADERIAALSRDLPHHWSEPTQYWKILAADAGALET